VTVAFDGSGSSDLESGSLTYSWNFGDGNFGDGVSPSHAYAASGSYTVSLVVNDGTDDSASESTTAVVGTAPPSGFMHVHDIDYLSIKGSKGVWSALVTFEVRDSSGTLVDGATVTGIFTQNGVLIGEKSCETGLNNPKGTCFANSGNFPKKSGKNTYFTVTSVTHIDLKDFPINDDPDGDSDGTVIKLAK